MKRFGILLLVIISFSFTNYGVDEEVTKCSTSSCPDNNRGQCRVSPETEHDECFYDGLGGTPCDGTLTLITDCGGR